MNPTSPRPIIIISTSKPDAVTPVSVRACAARYPIREAATKTAPPIVGVPRLLSCDPRPSTRMGWP
jgi:hypothetical protein